jgi:hypothetical protein
VNDQNDAIFNEIKGIIERRYTRRMRAARRLLQMIVLSSLAVIGYGLYMDMILERVRRDWSTSHDYMVQHEIGVAVTVLLIAIAVGWFLIALFDMFVGNARDRALRQEIDREREWRLRQWGMIEEAPPSYLLDDDGEIEPYQVKRKHIRE